RAIHDADSHVVETPEMLREFADPAIRDRLDHLEFYRVVGGHGRPDDFPIYRQNHADPAYRDRDVAELMLRKNWHATGSFLKEDRPRALDMLGFKSQLVFNTFWNAYLLRLEHGKDIELAYGAARAHNRAMLDFCSVDRRLLASCYVPLADFDRASAMAGEAIKAGARTLLIRSACPKGHSPSHVDLDPVWGQAAEAGIPVVMHVGGHAPFNRDYFENGMPRVKDFHGGAENFRSIDYMGILVASGPTPATMFVYGGRVQVPPLHISAM